MSLLPRSFRVLRHRDLRLVVIGNLVSQLGTWSQYVGVGWAAQELTDSKVALGVAFAAPLAASLFLSPFAGVIADRFDRRKLVMYGNVAMALPPVAVGLLLHQEAIGVGMLIFLVFLGGVAQALTMPASMALVPQLVPLGEVQQAVALNSGMTNATRIIGPGIGGFAISTWGIDWAFHLNAISFSAVVIAWWFVHVPALAAAADTESFGERLRAGFTYARRNRSVGRLLLLTAVGAFCVMHAPLMPVIVKELLDGDAGTYALLSSAPGVGAFIGAIAAGEITGGQARRRTMAVCAIGMAASLLVLSLSRITAVTAACLVLFGLGYFLLNALVTTVVVVATADEYRGRVMGFLSMANAGIVPLNAVSAGVLASLLGPAWTVGLAASVLLVFSAGFVATGKFSMVGGADADEPPPRPDAAPGIEVLGVPAAAAAAAAVDDPSRPPT
ncbi:MAG: MFS transporter [Acidimicrobiia bacterium]